jgi:hypothetical protein
MAKYQKRMGEQHGPVDDMTPPTPTVEAEPSAQPAPIPRPRMRARPMAGHHAQMGTLRVHGGKLG